MFGTYLEFTHSCTESKICLQLFFNLQSPTESHSSISNPFFDFVQGWGIKPKRPIALFLPRLTRLRIPTGPHNNRNLFFFANFLILTLHTQVHNLFSLSFYPRFILDHQCIHNSLILKQIFTQERK